jgi:hypothetical protein
MYFSFVIIFGTHIQAREDADGLQDNKGLLAIKLLDDELPSSSMGAAAAPAAPVFLVPKTPTALLFRPRVSLSSDICRLIMISLQGKWHRKGNEHDGGM